MWDKRITALVGILIAIIVFAVWFEKKEAKLWLGLPVASEESLREAWGDGAFYDSLENAEEILLFNGNEIPYDKNTNTFYITQNIENDGFDGVLGAAVDGLEVYLLSDGYAFSKNAGIAEGHVYRIWICDGSAATICNVTMSGLPIVSVEAVEMQEIKEDNADGLPNGKDYADGKIAVWTPEDEDFGGVSDRNSYMKCKRSASGETITCKLRTKKGDDSKKVSFLSMGKYDAWKLYKVPETDETCVRMMLAYQMWNACSSKQELSAPCHFVELVVNNEYQGLSVLRPRMDDDYFGLPEKDMVIQTEDNPSDEALYSAYRPENAADFGLWVQAACAYANLFEDMIILDDGETSFFLPGKAEHVFGCFPGRYAYLAYRKEQRVITAADFKWQGEDAAEFDADMALRWAQARSEFLGDDALAAAVWEQAEELKRAGVSARRGIADESIAAFLDDIRLRYAQVDRYYEMENSR